MGLTEDDIDNMSDKFIDATFAWGSEQTIQNRIKEHFDAGADHVSIQPVNTNGKLSELDWDCLELLSPNRD